MNRRPLMLISTAATGAALMLGVVACGSSSSNSASPDTGTTAPATATAPATDTMAGETTTAPAETDATTPAVPAAPKSRVIQVVLGKPKEFSLVPARAGITAGKVTFKIVNRGAMTHELVVIKTAKKAGALPKDASGRADETGNLGESGDMAAGTSAVVTLNLKPGHYALICNLPGHYAGGMWANFTVR